MILIFEKWYNGQNSDEDAIKESIQSSAVTSENSEKQTIPLEKNVVKDINEKANVSNSDFLKEETDKEEKKLSVEFELLISKVILFSTVSIIKHGSELESKNLFSVPFFYKGLNCFISKFKVLHHNCRLYHFLLF